MAAAAAMRKNFYLGKKSEYRQNYLPFDYYDFWITAKENENLRCRNKLRDYLHTPFDWDEGQEFYLETVTNSIDLANHATQTSARPNRRDHLKKVNRDFEQQIAQQQHQINVYKDLQQQQKQHQANNQTRSAQLVETQQPSRPHTANQTQQTQYNQQQQQKQAKPARTAISRRQRRNKKQKAVVRSPSQNLAIGPKIEVQGVYANLNDGRGVVSKPRHAPPRATSAQDLRFRPASSAESAFEKFDDSAPHYQKSQTNIAIQTPLGWNLRDFKSNSRPSSAAVVAKKQVPARPASAISLQTRKAPFANYGWATKTKDLSVKPTHNALANKSLAREHDENAVLELTLHKLKKDATRVANEYSTIESRLAEHFLTGRSETRAWNSEYDDRYPDYSKTPLKKDLYMQDNPYKLAKSQLVLNYPPLKRGPRSATKKIFFD